MSFFGVSKTTEPVPATPRKSTGSTSGSDVTPRASHLTSLSSVRDSPNSNFRKPRSNLPSPTTTPATVSTTPMSDEGSPFPTPTSVIRRLLPDSAVKSCTTADEDFVGERSTASESQSHSIAEEEAEVESGSHDSRALFHEGQSEDESPVPPSEDRRMRRQPTHSSKPVQSVDYYSPSPPALNSRVSTGSIATPHGRKLRSRRSLSRIPDHVDEVLTTPMKYPTTRRRSHYARNDSRDYSDASSSEDDARSTESIDSGFERARYARKRPSRRSRHFTRMDSSEHRRGEPQPWIKSAMRLSNTKPLIWLLCLAGMTSLSMTFLTNRQLGNDIHLNQHHSHMALLLKPSPKLELGLSAADASQINSLGGGLRGNVLHQYEHAVLTPEKQLIPPDQAGVAGKGTQHKDESHHHDGEHHHHDTAHDHHHDTAHDHHHDAAHDHHHDTAHNHHGGHEEEKHHHESEHHQEKNGHESDHDQHEATDHHKQHEEKGHEHHSTDHHHHHTHGHHHGVSTHHRNAALKQSDMVRKAQLVEKPHRVRLGEFVPPPHTNDMRHFPSQDKNVYSQNMAAEDGMKRRTVFLDDAMTDFTPRHRTVQLYPTDFSDNTQLYAILDSSDERIKTMELREPLEHDECVPMKEWQTTFHPTCNEVHEVDMDHLGRDDGDELFLFGTKGYWRNAWRFDSKAGRRTRAERDTIVLKTLKIEHRFEEAHFEHDRVDAIAMERLTASPHVINIFGYCGHSVMTEYADGKRLGELADKQSKNPGSRLRIARDVANGLADMHGIDGDGNATFVHLDVNPANVVSVGGTLKLNDFNIGILRTWNTTSNSPCGFPAQYPNPQWRSPEEAREEQHLTEKVDIFSLGHIFFRLICGHEPWHKLEPGGRPSKEEVNAKVMRGVLPTIPREIMETNDTEVVAIRDEMLRCYEFHPDKRPSAREIARSLDFALEHFAETV